MISLPIWIIVFIASVAVLVKASDYFTESAEKIGVAFRIPSFIIGGTIVAFGTSLPELVSSLIAVINGVPEIVLGNVIGSNITNIALILGIAALFTKRTKVDHELIDVDLPILFGSSVLLTFALLDGIFSLPEALLFIGGIVLYTLYTVFDDKRESIPIEKEVKKGTPRRKLSLSIVATLILSGVFVWLGARYTVESVLNLSHILNINTELIALFAVALGTSLPELAVTISAVRRGQGEIAVGNILGSNIFNTFAVMGIPALFGTLTASSDIITFYLPYMVGLTLLFFFMTQDKALTRWEGALLCLCYVFFIIKLVGL